MPAFAGMTVQMQGMTVQMPGMTIQMPAFAGLSNNN